MFKKSEKHSTQYSDIQTTLDHPFKNCNQSQKTLIYAPPYNYTLKPLKITCLQCLK